MIKNIFFDLDNTLIPMDEDNFIKLYFGALTKRLIPFGFDKDMIQAAVWSGTKAMVMNNGEKSNEEVFWETFVKIVGEEILKYKYVIDDFYKNDFIVAKAATGFDPKAEEIIKILKTKYRLYLTTNPIFPKEATMQRAAWSGCDLDNFEYVTTYENSSFCKPNPKYFEEVLLKNNLKAEETIMVGNDLYEDGAAKAIGIKVFIIEKNLINRKNQNLDDFDHGDFDDLLKFINSLDC